MDFVNGVHKRKATQKDQPEEIRPSEIVALLVCHGSCHSERREESHSASYSAFSRGVNTLM